MRPSLKPIPTLYNGYRFRSRLEARWAVFFDRLGIPWEYEEQGYDLGTAGWYLPDFVVDRQREAMTSLYVEVKPQSLRQDAEGLQDCVDKCAALGEQSHSYSLVVFGDPVEHVAALIEPVDRLYLVALRDCYQCDGTHMVSLDPECGCWFAVKCSCQDMSVAPYSAHRVSAAALASRQFRFRENRHG